MAAKPKFQTVDDYVRSLAADVQTIAGIIRQTILDTAPNAVETISYGMPTYKQNGKVLAFFAVWKDHIGFYDRPKGHAKFDRDAAPYMAEKDTLRFPLAEPAPLDLIRRFVELRLKH
jgi:uncharacterized protein YdhG (YjbR/CyaY superfamily)